MRGSIEQYVRQEGDERIIDRDIIGEKIQANDGSNTGQVLSVSRDAGGEYITVKGPEGIYGIRIPVFKFYQLIE